MKLLRIMAKLNIYLATFALISSIPLAQSLLTPPSVAANGVVNLIAGESDFDTLDQGVVIVVGEGAVKLKTQLYLAGSMFSYDIRPSNGMSYMAESTQHYQLQALTKTRLTLISTKR